MKKITSIGIAFLAATPFLASAQLNNVRSLVSSVGGIIRLLIPILVALAIVVFFWGLVKYIRTSGKGHDEGRNIMIAGLISLFVMASLWGIIGFAGSAIGINQTGGGVNAPTVNGI